MSFFNLETDGMEQAKDILGGYSVLPSGIYEATIKAAYAGESKGGAKNISFILDIDGREHSETIYITSGKEKGCKPYYMDKDNKKQPLPGYVTAQAIGLLSAGKDLNQLSAEDKIIEIYDWEIKDKKKTKVNMFMDLLNKKIKVGLIHRKQFKQTKGDDGKYHPTTDIREFNEIDKVFRAKDDKTVAEIRAKAEEASFIQEWKGKWDNKIDDKTGGTSNNTQSNQTASTPALADDPFA